MTNPRNVQGSNAEVAEGGLNPEDAFVSFEETTAEAKARQSAARGTGLEANGINPLKQTPGGKGTGAGLDQNAPR